MPIWRFGLLSWLRRKTVDPLLLIVRRGAEPKQLAFSAAVGVTLGLFPICGTTVFLCGIAITFLRHRCHAPTMMFTNVIVTPVELSLIIPFLRLGETISGGPHFPLTSDALKKVITGQASKEVLLSILNALLGWLVTSPFIACVLYLIFLPCFKFLVGKFGGTVPSGTRKPNDSHPDVKLKIRNF